MSTLKDIIDFLNALQEQAGEIRSQLIGFQTQVEAVIAPGPEFSRMKSALQRLAAADSQEKILQNYLKEAVAMTEAGILFLLEGGAYVPRKASGFSIEDVQPVSLSDESNPLILSTSQRRIMVRLKDLNELFPWLKSLDELPQAAVCIPLVFEDAVPAAVYLHTSSAIPMDALELLTHLATLVCKNHALRQTTAAQPQSAGVASERNAPETPESLAGEIAETITEERSGEQLPWESTFEEDSDAAAAESVAAETSFPQFGFGASERQDNEEEEESAIEPAPPLGGGERSAFHYRSEEPAFADREQEEDSTESELTTAADDAFPEEVGFELPLPSFEPPEPTAEKKKQVEQPKDPHAEAKRLSRLLVSEIKLYNSQKVNAGRRGGDLYARLKAEIDAGREKYHKQVDASVAAQRDYYHEELVSILAMGDERLMGAEYPGPDL